MNEWNNAENLEHYKGVIWVSKLFKTENRGNVCARLNGKFKVLAYISPDRLTNKPLETVVAEVVKAQGLEYMLEN